MQVGVSSGQSALTSGTVQVFHYKTRAGSSRSNFKAGRIRVWPNLPRCYP